MVQNQEKSIKLSDETADKNTIFFPDYERRRTIACASKPIESDKSDAILRMGHKKQNNRAFFLYL